jgi:hypothetical protein
VFRVFRAFIILCVGSASACASNSRTDDRLEVKWRRQTAVLVTHRHLFEAPVILEHGDASFYDPKIRKRLADRCESAATELI